MKWGEDYTGALVGKTVTGIDVSDSEGALRFRCADGTVVVWETEGDCCSESWWADITGLAALRGQVVTAAREIEMPDYNVEDGRTRQEYDSAYGVRADTVRGTAQFVFRNSSNGYYGGVAGLGEDVGYKWREIVTDEWSA
jgi:hypothetical protein